MISCLAPLTDLLPLCVWYYFPFNWSYFDNWLYCRWTPFFTSKQFTLFVKFCFFCCIFVAFLPFSIKGHTEVPSVKWLNLFFTYYIIIDDENIIYAGTKNFSKKFKRTILLHNLTLNSNYFRPLINLEFYWKHSILKSIFFLLQNQQSIFVICLFCNISFCVNVYQNIVFNLLLAKDELSRPGNLLFQNVHVFV